MESAPSTHFSDNVYQDLSQSARPHEFASSIVLLNQGDDAMPTDDISPHAVEVGAKQKTTRYTFTNAFLTIGFALLAGMRVNRSIQYFRAGKSDWQFEVLMGLFWLVFSIFCVSRLIAKRGEAA
jgi:hypothetical protein